MEPLTLFFIIFLWTPPHFWALALNRADDYASSGAGTWSAVQVMRVLERMA